MNSDLFFFIILSFAFVFIAIALIGNYWRYKQIISKMVEQVHKVERDWNAEFEKTPLLELSQTEPGKQLLTLEGISEKTPEEKHKFTKVGERIFYDEIEVELPSKLTQILAILIENKGKATTIEEIAEKLFGSTDPAYHKTIYQLLGNLRKSLSNIGEPSEELILFIPNKGLTIQPNIEIEILSKSK